MQYNAKSHQGLAGNTKIDLRRKHVQHCFPILLKIKSASIFSVKTFLITTEEILTFCRSWEPEYLAAIDLISPPNAEAQSFTL